jgi:recombination protein RecA
MGTTKEKLALLDGVLKEINKDKRFKRNSGDLAIAKLSERPQNVETISTGSLVLDELLGGGLGKGRIIEIFGPESSGKTSIALTAIANVQKEGGVAVFIDAENALDPRYAAKLGVDVDNLAVAQPESAEETMDMINALTHSGVVDIIALDSVASLVPLRELEGEAKDLTVGELARLLSKELRKLTGVASKNGVTLIFLNQIRDKVGGFSPFGTPQTTPGGKALKFYASQRIKINKGKQLDPDKNGRASSTEIKFKVEKSKIAPPGASGQTVISFNKGINQFEEMIVVGAEYGVISRPNNRTYLDPDTNEVIGSSRADAVERLTKDKALMEKLQAKLRDALSKDRFGIEQDAAEEEEDIKVDPETGEILDDEETQG